MHYPSLYSPTLITENPIFKIVEEPVKDTKKNIACCYNEKKEIHMVERAIPTPRNGEVLLRVRSVFARFPRIRQFRPLRNGGIQFFEEIIA